MQLVFPSHARALLRSWLGCPGDPEMPKMLNLTEPQLVDSEHDV